MRRIIFTVITLVMVSSLIGCTSLSSSEREMFNEITAYGISPTEHKVKEPGAAAVLNLLPGFGNFYLAAGTEESAQWLYGFLNLLFWPVSVIWGVPQAAIDANTINKKETIYYYKFDPQGKQEFENIKGTSE